MRRNLARGCHLGCLDGWRLADLRRVAQRNVQVHETIDVLDFLHGVAKAAAQIFRRSRDHELRVFLALTRQLFLLVLFDDDDFFAGGLVDEDLGLLERLVLLLFFFLDILVAVLACRGLSLLLFLVRLMNHIFHGVLVLCASSRVYRVLRELLERQHLFVVVSDFFLALLNDHDFLGALILFFFGDGQLSQLFSGVVQSV